jgi:hypothetical protein
MQYNKSPESSSTRFSLILIWLQLFLQVSEKKDELSYDDLTNDVCPVSVFL